MIMGNNDQLNIWQEIVNRFKNVATQFQQKHDEMLYYLNTIQNYSPEIQREYKSLLSHGDLIKSVIQKTTNTIDSVAQWISSTFSGYLKQDVNINQLGGIQFLPIAVVAGSVALLGKWISDVIILFAKLNEIERLQQTENLTPKQAYDRVSELEGGFNLNFLKPLTPILLLGFAFLIIPQIKRLST